MIPQKLQAKGLICFEEISDYSILNEINKNGKKRKLIEESSQPKNVKIKKLKKTKPAKKLQENLSDESKDKQIAKKLKKKVKFDKNLEILNGNEKKQLSVKEKKKLRKEKKEKLKLLKSMLKDGNKQMKKKAKKTTKKEQKSNSTSKISLHTMADEQKDFDQEEFNEKMKAWSDFMLPQTLLRGLYDKEFYEPMPIQKLVLPVAIKTKENIIGTAQTGSGKTLAFGLPILTHLIDSNNSKSVLDKSDKFSVKNAPQALILTPTRELAIQIKDHLQKCCKYEKIKIVVVVGGISQKKQERLLNKNPEIIVATPGRLMQMIDEGHEYLNKISDIKYLVIDEADRMIEKGHFGEMEKILNIVNSDEKLKSKRQNFLFSATLITKFTGSYEESDEKTDAQMKRERKVLLNSLVDKIQMKEPKVFDLTTKAVTADSLIESKIFCSLNEKDAYLYYFTCKYVGRTLVFSNSIDCVRRLTNLFRLMKKEPLHLHANMTQKQRLKNLEKFNAQENSFLIASDVASRGLDIPGVKHVIHYQVPRSAEIYVHRSGRTARSSNEGLSVMLISPDEISLYKKILRTFKKEKDLKDYPIDNAYFDECKARTNLARKIDEIEHQLNKEKSNTNWYEKHAKLVDIELDDEILKETYVDNNQLAKKKQTLRQLKVELEKRLKQNTILPKFMSKSYLQSDSLNKILNMNKSNQNAINEIKTNKKKVKKFFKK